jgi:hypothetical protein
MWQGRAQAEHPGLVSYATRQKHLWYRMAEQAFRLFKGKIEVDQDLERAFVH